VLAVTGPGVLVGDQHLGSRLKSISKMTFASSDSFPKILKISPVRSHDATNPPRHTVGAAVIRLGWLPCLTPGAMSCLTNPGLARSTVAVHA
jgi:hypothetical protein